MKIQKTVTLNVVEARDFEQLVTDTYGVEDFYLAEKLECRNGHCELLTVSGDPLSDHERRTFDRDGIDYWSCNTIMNDLCIRGLVEPGEYLIDVSW